MSNLIWSVSRTDCYCGLNNNQIVSFEVQSKNDCLVLFAELQPNTTYTIQRLDNSSRMRWGIGSKYDNFYYATATLDACFSQGSYPDDSEPHTFTTSKGHLVEIHIARIRIIIVKNFIRIICCNRS